MLILVRCFLFFIFSLRRILTLNEKSSNNIDVNNSISKVKKKGE